MRFKLKSLYLAPKITINVVNHRVMTFEQIISVEKKKENNHCTRELNIKSFVKEILTICNQYCS